MAGCGERPAHRAGEGRQRSGYRPRRTTPTPLLDARSDQQGQRRRPAGRLDVLHRRAARPRRRAARSSATSMYVHTPFPNIVYALDLNNDGAIKWKYEPVQDPNVIPVMCCDTVNRGAGLRAGGRRLSGADHPAPGRHDGRGAQRRHRRRGLEGEVRRSEPGRDRHQRADGREGQGHQRRVGRRVRRAGLRRGLQSEGRLGSLARLLDGPGRPDADGSGEDHASRQAGRPGFRHDDLGRRPVEDRRRHDVGLVFLRSGARPRSTTAPATPRPGTRTSVPATTAGP